MSATPPISPSPTNAPPSEGTTISSRPKRKGRFFRLPTPSQNSPASTNIPSRLPAISTDLLGVMEERKKERLMHSSASGPSHSQAPKHAEAQRKTETTWRTSKASSGPSDDNRRSHAGGASSGPSDPRVFEDKNFLRQLRNPLREPSNSPLFEMSDSLDSITEQFILDMQALGFDFSGIDLSGCSYSQLDTLRSRVLEICHQDTAERMVTPVGTPSQPSTIFEKFEMLYTAVATTVNPHLSVEVPQEIPATFSYTASTNDKGGHGGTKKVTIEYQGQIYHLFLKPKDKAEVLGYELTKFFDKRRQENSPQHRVPQVSEFMAKTYGVITIDNREYFVMQDLTASGNHPVMDVKPAYCIENLDNPIASIQEIQQTGRSKPFLDYFQMKLGARLSGGYMIAHPDKIKRFINYRNSQETFRNNLHQHYTLDQVRHMRKQLKALLTAIGIGEIAYIGSSFLFLQNGLYFIDPAHPQVRSTEENDDNFREHFASQSSRIYFGTEEEFSMRRASTIFSISLMLEHMKAVVEDKKAREQMLRQDGPPLDTEGYVKREGIHEPKQREKPRVIEADYAMRESEKLDGPPLNI